MFGINNLNSSTGVAAFTALNFTACTSLCPWPPGCVLQQPKVNLAAACSPNSFESTHYYWYNLYWGPFSPSMFGMMVTFASADDSTHICLADVDPAKGYSVVAATTSKLPSNVDRRFAWSVEAFGDSGRRRLASVIGFYPPHGAQTRERDARVDAWLRDQQGQPQHIYFNVTGIRYPAFSLMATAVSADASAWFFVNRDYNGVSFVQLGRTIIDLPSSSYSSASPDVRPSLVAEGRADLSAKVGLSSDPAKKPWSRHPTLETKVGSQCSNRAEGVWVRGDDRDVHLMKPGVTYIGNISANVQAQFAIDLPYDLTSVVLTLSAETKFSQPLAIMTVLNQKAAADVQPPKTQATISAAFLPKVRAFINVTSSYNNNQLWSSFGICAEVTSAESVVGHNRMTVRQWTFGSAPIAVVRREKGEKDDTVSVLQTQLRDSRGFNLTGYRTGPVGQPPKVVWNHQLESKGTLKLRNNATHLIALSAEGGLQSIDFASGAISQPVPIKIDVSSGNPVSVGFSRDRVVILAGGLGEVRRNSPGFPFLFTFPADFSDGEQCSPSLLADVAVDNLGYSYVSVACGLTDLYVFGPAGRLRFFSRYSNSAFHGLPFTALQDMACWARTCYRGIERYSVGGVPPGYPPVPFVRQEDNTSLLLVSSANKVYALREDVLDAQNPAWQYSLPISTGIGGPSVVAGTQMWLHDNSGLVLVALDAAKGTLSSAFTWPSSYSFQSRWLGMTSTPDGILYATLETPFGVYFFVISP